MTHDRSFYFDKDINIVKGKTFNKLEVRISKGKKKNEAKVGEEGEGNGGRAKTKMNAVK